MAIENNRFGYEEGRGCSNASFFFTPIFNVYNNIPANRQTYPVISFTERASCPVFCIFALHLLL